MTHDLIGYAFGVGFILILVWLGNRLKREKGRKQNFDK